MIQSPDFFGESFDRFHLTGLDADAAEKSRRERLLRHLESADKAHPLELATTAWRELARLLGDGHPTMTVPFAGLDRGGETLAINNQKHRFEKLTKRLEALHYSQNVIDRLRDLTSVGDSNEIRLIDIRTALEKFLEDSARLSPRYGGPRVDGDFSRPSVVRKYLENGSWITTEELEFITAFYGLMSNVDGHAGDSMLDPLAAKHALWSVVDTISHRILNRPRRPGVAREEGKIEQALANEFVEALRAGKSEGRAFEPTFTESTMKKVRQRLTKNDTESLWKLMDNSSAHPELRNRSASLLLGERLAEYPEEQG